MLGLENQVGFSEDRAATALMECQGSYKSQHDTHKGIRTLQVWMRVHRRGFYGDATSVSWCNVLGKYVVVTFIYGLRPAAPAPPACA